MNKPWLIVLAALVVAGAFFGIGYAAGDGGHDGNDDHGMRNDQMAVLMANGSMQSQMGTFVEMMNDLRDQMTPEMRSRMDDDAMWELMESGDLMKMMRELGHDMRDVPGMPGMGGGGHRGGGGNGMGG